MVDAVERLGQVQRRHRRYETLVGVGDKALGNVEQGVLRRVVRPVRILAGA